MEATAAKLLIHPHSRSHTFVKYMCSPGGSGKSSSVLPAFLAGARPSRTAPFTHYLYLAFDNNNKRFFRLDGNPSTYAQKAEAQGAAFILECVKKLLQEPDVEYPCVIRPSDRPRSTQDLDDLFQDHLGSSGRPFKCLVHVDGKTCSQELATSGEFHRGALEALQSCSRVTVIATYVEPPELPPDVEPSLSSGVCRDPVPLPCLDIDAAMDALFPTHFARLHTAVDHSDGAVKRQWATLRFVLAHTLTRFGLASFHRPGTSTASDAFLRSFQAALKGPVGKKQIKSTLKKCIELCTRSLPLPLEESDEELAAEMLAGVPDSPKALPSNRQLDDLVVLPNGNISFRFIKLMLIYDLERSVYNTGRDRFRRVVSHDALEWLEATPLEAAFTWALACRAAVDGSLQFGPSSPLFDVRCPELLHGRIFHGDNNMAFTVHDKTVNDNTVHDNTVGDSTGDVPVLALDTVEHGCLYYTTDRHPLADLFFRTDTGKDLVLIDITGGAQDLTLQKARRLQEWIKKAQPVIKKTTKPGSKQITVHGVVLAPGAATPTSGGEVNDKILGAQTVKELARQRVYVVCGNDARDFLGGLDQVYRWFESE